MVEVAARRGRAKSPENMRLDRPTGLAGRIDNVAEFSSKSNCDEEAQNENPGALAGATGAEDVVESVCRSFEHTAVCPILATHWEALA